MNEELTKWFTEHGAVISAEKIEDRNDKTNLSGLIRYVFADGAVLTIRPPEFNKDGQEVRPQEIVGRELPKPKEPSTSSQAAAPGGAAWKDDGPEAGSNGRRWGWNPETRLYDRDLGPSPYAQGLTGPQQAAAAKEAEANKPQAGKPYKNAQGQWVQNVVDAQGNIVGTTPVPPEAVPQEGDGAKSSNETKPIDGHPGWLIGKRSKTDAQGNTTTETYFINPQGQETTTGPAQPGQPIKYTGNDGKTYIQPTDANGLPVGQPTALPGTGQAPLPEGMPELDLSSPEAAHQSYLQQVRWAQSQRAQGKMSAADARDLITPSYQAVSSMIGQQQQAIENANASRRIDQQTEATRLSASTTQFPNAFNLVDYALRWGPVGGNEAAGLLAANVGLQTAMNQNVRGNVLPAVGAMAPGTPAPSPAPSLPTPAAASEPPPPNALGLGAIGNLAAPGAPPSPPALPPPLLGPPPAMPGQTPIAAPSATPTTPTTPTGMGMPQMDTGEAELEALNRMPYALQQLYGRSILDQILASGRYG